jgi:peptidoglycan/xylan/chitin deacetylase (PgdA/CDA1 family)
MKHRASLLLGTLVPVALALVTGCGSAASSAVTTPAALVAEPSTNRPASMSASLAQGVAEGSGAASNRLADLAVPGASAPVSRDACKLGEGRTANGFYASDAWAKGEVVLTFDDGPHPKGTPRVLDLLAEHEMPATFFVVGRAISRDTYPLVQRMIAEGHTLGTHSYSHDVHMTDVHAPARSTDDILGQHQVTTQLVDLAVLATSGDDFDAMFRRIYAHDPRTWLAASAIRKDRATFAARHRDVLAERGFVDGSRPYDVLYSRPPGGGPYVEHDGRDGIALHDSALAGLSLLNVMWHGASGDTDPALRSDFAFLTRNMEKTAEAGGVLLIHDYIRPDALAHSLGVIARSPDVRVIPMEEAVRRKFGCEASALGETLKQG